jgi:hypothetical protein
MSTSGIQNVQRNFACNDILNLWMEPVEDVCQRGSKVTVADAMHSVTYTACFPIPQHNKTYGQPYPTIFCQLHPAGFNAVYRSPLQPLKQSAST